MPGAITVVVGARGGIGEALLMKHTLLPLPPPRQRRAVIASLSARYQRASCHPSYAGATRCSRRLRQPAAALPQQRRR